MENSSVPVRHPKRQLGPCGPVQAVPDVVDQTTARIHALNDTLRTLAVSASDPNQQSKDERDSRKRLRREVYAELGRLVGPAERVELVVVPSKSSEQLIVAGLPSEESVGGAHAGL